MAWALQLRSLVRQRLEHQKSALSCVRGHESKHWVFAGTGLSRGDILGVGYDEAASAVVWRRFGSAGPESHFAVWLNELALQPQPDRF